MFPDWQDPLDQLNPISPLFWSEWVCPNCGEDGDEAELDEERHCPQCGSDVDPI